MAWFIPWMEEIQQTTRDVEYPAKCCDKYWWSPDFCCASTGTSKGQGFCVLLIDGGTNLLPKQPQTDSLTNVLCDLLLDSVKRFENIANKLGKYSIPARFTPRSLLIFTQLSFQRLSRLAPKIQQSIWRFHHFQHFFPGSFPFTSPNKKLSPQSATN